MTRSIARIFTLVVGALLVAGVAIADSVDRHITDLKSDKAEVRARAAHDLGCG